MKIGDKVYCYRDRLDNSNYFGAQLVHKQGKIYTITQVEIDSVFVTSEILEFNGTKTYKYRTVFSDIYWQFNDIFITVKEYRKQKLKQLNERI